MGDGVEEVAEKYSRAAKTDTPTAAAMRDADVASWAFKPLGW